MTINPVNGDVYIADAIDYVQNGVVLRYSAEGELLDTLPSASFRELLLEIKIIGL